MVGVSSAITTESPIHGLVTLQPEKPVQSATDVGAPALLEPLRH